MTLYISDIRFYKKQGIIYCIASIVTVLFGLIYEMFSHGVISNYMIFAFTIPLTLGVLVSFLMYALKMKQVTRVQISLYNASVATLTLWSILNGVLEIYGTTNWKVNLYLGLYVLLFLGSLIVGAIDRDNRT